MNMDFQYENERIFLADSSGKLLAEITFPTAADGVAELNHTFVDASLRGQGVAGQLMTAAVKKLSTENKKVRCLCSYAISWFEKHPEHHSMLANR